MLAVEKYFFLIFFMKLAMSEFCPVLYGYDQSAYRYEILLKD